MKAKLEERLRFRTWTFESETDLEMKSWILRNVATLSGITCNKAELSEAELKDLIIYERELAKWYTIWHTLFESLPVPLHPCRFSPFPPMAKTVPILSLYIEPQILECFGGLGTSLDLLRPSNLNLCRKLAEALT